ncbi:hypothetical protein V8C37DRAFT_392664 [Trichoderma ceciliae]
MEFLLLLRPSPPDIAALLYAYETGIPRTKTCLCQLTKHHRENGRVLSMVSPCCGRISGPDQPMWLSLDPLSTPASSLAKSWLSQLSRFPWSLEDLFFGPLFALLPLHLPSTRFRLILSDLAGESRARD